MWILTKDQYISIASYFIPKVDKTRRRRIGNFAQNCHGPGGLIHPGHPLAMSMIGPTAPVAEHEAPPPYSTLPAPSSGHGGPTVSGSPRPSTPLPPCSVSPAQHPGVAPHHLGPAGIMIQGTPPAYTQGQPVASHCHNLRLGYADFVPRLTRKRYFKEDKYESHE